MPELAPLHPSHATEPTPLFYAALLAHNTRTVVADVREGLVRYRTEEAPPRSPLFPEAAEWVEVRKGKTLTRQWFQRSMRVGWVTRDRLLLDLADAGLIRRLDDERFEVAP